MPATKTPAGPFAWQIQPAAARWVGRAIDSFRRRQPTLERLSDLLLNQTGTRLVDWVDQLLLGSEDSSELCRELPEVGYVADRESEQSVVWRHPQGVFPPVVVDGGGDGVGLRVESVEAGLAALPDALSLPPGRVGEPIGERGGPFRQARLDAHHGINVWMIERHGYSGFKVPETSSTQIVAAARHLEAFRNRERRLDTADEGFEQASRLFAAAAEVIGADWACDLFFQAEREYWQSRNRAGRVQYERQNRLGLGWANHDHHTYRSSRAAFPRLIATLEEMGFECRERFYAGREAGWGAQVLEQPQARVVIFADVDLTPDEVAGDFAHQPFGECELGLGTVGLWCELHGEAFLEAGMHHLECQFDFDAARSQLAVLGVETMEPFTDFPYLKQAFTRGEMWRVDPQRFERLLADGLITADQAARFRVEGALGSHMEILERNDGYKGFNQTGISEIITRTDPRRAIGA
jgi:hypothetical protein